MSTALRVILIAGAFLTFAYILRRVKKCDMSVTDTVFWIVISVALILIAVFPQLAFAMASLMGFVAPINFVFVFVIAVLIFKVFSLSVEISRLKGKLAALAQAIGIDRNGK